MQQTGIAQKVDFFGKVEKFNLILFFSKNENNKVYLYA